MKATHFVNNNKYICTYTYNLITNMQNNLIGQTYVSTDTNEDPGSHEDMSANTSYIQVFPFSSGTA